MKTINLKDYYSCYTTNCIIDIPDEVAGVLAEYKRREAAYHLRRYRNKAYYSLDRGDGIEQDILFMPMSPCEMYERKVTVEQLYASIVSLPDKQANRIYAYYFLGMSKAEIARAEGVNKSQVTRSIKKALVSIASFLSKGGCNNCL